jgi:chromosome segregation ATPase
MKVRDLLIVGAFVLGGAVVAYWGDAIKALRTWHYTAPLCVQVEEAWADATGASKAKLANEIAMLEGRLEAARDVKGQLREALNLSIQEVGEADAHVAKLADALAHSERVRDTQEQQLSHQGQLLSSQESVIRETNHRYQALVSRIRDLGRDDALAGLVRE